MPGSAEERTTLIVVHWNRPQECATTVRLLLQQRPNLRVVVVDNASRPECYTSLTDQLGPAAQFVRLTENKGWGGALNVVLRTWLSSGIGSYCLISAHDAAPAENCLSLLFEAAEKDARIGIACPQYPDETVPGFSALRGVYYHHGTVLPDGTAEEVSVPHGTLMLLRRECLAQIGLFNERYFAYGDEHELGARAGRAGWKVVLVWGAIVTNPGTWTSSPLRSYLFARNSLFLVREYFGMASAWLRALFIAANTVRLLVRSPGEAFAFSPKARFLAIKDYFTGRHGLPDWAG